MRFKGLAAFFAFLLIFLASMVNSPAQDVPGAAVASSKEPVVPNYFDPKERLVLPDISSFPRIRFLTTTDFPPFNFIDQTGKLAGFHIDLARDICEELKIADKCQIQALPWSDLETALENGQGEAIIAGLAVTARNREKYAFTRSYLQFPARFVRNRAVALPGPMPRALDGKKVGVVKDSAQEAMLKAFFPKIEASEFASDSDMLKALKDKKIGVVFGDGMQLSFWLSSKPADNCCAFLGGPYLSEHFLGHGLAIAVLRKNAVLAGAFDHALLALSRDGRFADLYRRYFPNGMY